MLLANLWVEFLKDKTSVHDLIKYIIIIMIVAGWRVDRESNREEKNRYLFTMKIHYISILNIPAFRCLNYIIFKLEKIYSFIEKFA